jgi:hypothetical protein
MKFRKELEHTKANYWLMCLELENSKERNAFLKLAKMGSTLKGAITYTFMDGNIPMLDGSMVDFEDFKVSDYKGLRVEISGMGPMVVFDSKDTLGYAVRSTRNFQDDKQELAKFLKLLKAAKK